jgi:hypothetical protein
MPLRFSLTFIWNYNKSVSHPSIFIFNLINDNPIYRDKDEEECEDIRILKKNRLHNGQKNRQHNGQKNRQHNGQKNKQRSTKHTYKTKDRVTRTLLKTGGELRCSVHKVILIFYWNSYYLDFWYQNIHTKLPVHCMTSLWWVKPCTLVHVPYWWMVRYYIKTNVVCFPILLFHIISNKSNNEKLQILAAH